MKATDIFLNQVKREFNANGQEIIFKFFMIFSRFEGALKSSFYINQSGDAKPDWAKFEQSIKKDFNINKTPELALAVKYILEEPPRVQTIDNNVLSWRTRSWPVNTPQINLIGQAIRDVRNNLFHGSKFNGHFEPDTSRNYQLLSFSISILEEWLSLNPLLQEEFTSPISR